MGHSFEKIPIEKPESPHHMFDKLYLPGKVNELYLPGKVNENETLKWLHHKKFIYKNISKIPTRIRDLCMQNYIFVRVIRYYLNKLQQQ